MQRDFFDPSPEEQQVVLVNSAIALAKASKVDLTAQSFTEMFVDQNMTYVLCPGGRSAGKCFS
jgi:hypothetical protein